MGKINYAVQRSERVPNNQKGRTSLSNAYPRHPDRPPPSSPFHPRTRALRTSWIPRSGMVMLIVSWSTRRPRHTPRYRFLSVRITVCFAGLPAPWPQYIPIHADLSLEWMTRRALWSRSCMSCEGSCAMRLIDIFMTNRCSLGDIRNGYVIRITAI